MQLGPDYCVLAAVLTSLLIIIVSVEVTYMPKFTQNYISFQRTNNRGTGI